MKKLPLFFATLGCALAVHAQPGVSQPVSPEALKDYPAASPNWTWTPEFSAATRRYKHHHHHKDKLDALVWVDATNKTVGRFYDESSMVVTFNDQLALVRGLRVFTCLPLGGACIYAGGSRWFDLPLANPLYYVSSDCTGQAYSFTRTTPATYYGFPVEKADAMYIYFFKLADRAQVMLNSFFTSKQCRATPQGFNGEVVPAAGMLPVSVLGLEPYAVK